MNFFTGYKNSIEIFHYYWKVYGGWRAVLRSFYFHIALAITIACWTLWKDGGWWDHSLNLLPSLLGFSLGAFAILLAFGNENFQRIMAIRPKDNKAAYESVATGFTHFIIVQFSGIALAFLAKAWYVEAPHWFWMIIESNKWIFEAYSMARLLFWGLGFLLLSYSVTCGVAATMRMLRLTRLLVNIETNNHKKPPENNDVSQN